MQIAYVEYAWIALPHLWIYVGYEFFYPECLVVTVTYEHSVVHFCKFGQSQSEVVCADPEHIVRCQLLTLGRSDVDASMSMRPDLSPKDRNLVKQSHDTTCWRRPP